MRILIALLLIATAAPVSASDTAGSEPQICLANRDIKARRMTAEQGYYVRTSKGWWHNLGPSCSAYGRNRALITQSLNNQQCRGDVMTVVDPFSRIEFGGCALGAWQQVAKAEVPPAKAR
jgi:hypothetical protein